MRLLFCDESVDIIIDYWLLITDYWLLIVDYWLLMTDDWLFTHYKFSAVFIKLRKFLMTDYWLLMTDYWLLMTDYWLLMSDYCLPFGCHAKIDIFHHNTMITFAADVQRSVLHIAFQARRSLSCFHLLFRNLFYYVNITQMNKVF